MGEKEKERRKEGIRIKNDVKGGRREGREEDTMF